MNKAYRINSYAKKRIEAYSKDYFGCSHVSSVINIAFETPGGLRALCAERHLDFENELLDQAGFVQSNFSLNSGNLKKLNTIAKLINGQKPAYQDALNLILVYGFSNAMKEAKKIKKGAIAA